MSLKWYSPAEHCIEEDTERPDVHEKALVTLIYDDLRSQISGSTTLFLDYLTFLDYLGHTEVADLHSFLAV